MGDQHWTSTDIRQHKRFLRRLGLNEWQLFHCGSASATFRRIFIKYRSLGSRDYPTNFKLHRTGIFVGVVLFVSPSGPDKVQAVD